MQLDLTPENLSLPLKKSVQVPFILFKGTTLYQSGWAKYQKINRWKSRPLILSQTRSSCNIHLYLLIQNFQISYLVSYYYSQENAN